MKFTCDLNTFRNALDIVSKSVDTNPTLPVLNNILFHVSGKRLTLSATNLESAARYSFEVNVKNEGSITLPAKVLNSYVSFLNTETIELNSTGDDVLIQAGKSKTKIKGLPTNEFPILPEVEKIISVKIKSQDLETALKQTTFVCSTNATRPTLSGVYFYHTEDKLVLVATDGYRLSEKIIPAIIKSTKKLQIIIPSRVLNELQKILDLHEDLEIIVGENQIVFKVDGVEMFSRLIEGNFPDYKVIIPKETKTTSTLQTTELLTATKQMGVLARDNNNSLKLETDTDSITLTAFANQVGEGESVLDAKNDGEKQTIQLNHEFLLSALNIIQSSEITLKFKDQSSPVIIQPKNDPQFLHLIMPLKS